MKKTTLFLSVVLLLIFVVACNNEKKDNNNTSNNSENNTEVTTSDMKQENQGIEFSLPTYKISDATIDIEEDEVEKVTGTNFSVYMDDGILYLLDNEYNAYNIGESNFYNTTYSGEVKEINGKNLLFLKWEYMDARSGFNDGYEEEYSSIQILDLENMICLADLLYTDLKNFTSQTGHFSYFIF